VAFREVAFAVMGPGSRTARAASQKTESASSRMRPRSRPTPKRS